ISHTRYFYRRRLDGYSPPPAFPTRRSSDLYDRESFEVLEVFSYPTEGWGLTHDGKHLIMSDGSSTLTFLDPETYKPVRQIEVTSSKGPVKNLNELEYIKGEIYANIWLTDYIVRIDPQTGKVTGWIDLSGLIHP